MPAAIGITADNHPASSIATGVKTKILFIIYFLFASAMQSHGQRSYYPYYNPDSTYAIKMAGECSKKVESSFVLPANVKKDYKKDYIESKNESVNYTKSLVRYTCVSDELLNPMLQSVYGKIVAGNPSLAGYTIILSDWPIMNAANVGGKVVIFYTPLISRLGNESQLAFILCHELAHGELDHLQKGLKKTLDDYYNKEFQKELKATMKEEFNVYAKMNLLHLKFTMGSRFHSRGLEKAADSLGYVFLSKTEYDVNEVIPALDVLQHVDEVAYKGPIDYSRDFKCGSSKYDFNLIKPYQKSSIFAEVENDNDTLVDSLRTHPDCAKRIAYIEALKRSTPVKAIPPADTMRFNALKWAAAMDMIQAYFDYEYYDHALFNALNYLEFHPDDEYLRTIIILSASKLYEAMKNHELSDYLTNYSEGNPVEFNNFLYMINNMRLSELSSLINCFYQKNVSKINDNEYSVAAGYMFSKVSDNGQAKTWQQKYKDSFKDGRFNYLLEAEQKTDPKKNKKH